MIFRSSRPISTGMLWQFFFPCSCTHSAIWMQKLTVYILRWLDNLSTTVVDPTRPVNGTVNLAGGNMHINVIKSWKIENLKSSLKVNTLKNTIYDLKTLPRAKGRIWPLPRNVLNFSVYIYGTFTATPKPQNVSLRKCTSNNMMP